MDVADWITVGFSGITIISVIAILRELYLWRKEFKRKL